MTQLVKSVRRVSAMLGKYQKKFLLVNEKYEFYEKIYILPKRLKKMKILEKNLKIVRPFLSALRNKNVINKFLK